VAELPRNRGKSAIGGFWSHIDQNSPGTAGAADPATS
jgi:hypothetical protein